jgi:hypothetical protein
MLGMALAKSIYAIPTWTRTVALVTEHPALRTAITGCAPDVPSVYACYRFTAKLRAYSEIFDRCIDRVTAGLSAELPEYGRNIAIDASDMPAYANGRSSPRTARSASATATRTQAGDIGARLAPARAAGSTATASTPRSAPPLTFPSRGR